MFLEMIATARQESLQSFKATPAFLMEICHHKILRSGWLSCDVITPSIEMMSFQNYANLLHFTE